MGSRCCYCGERGYTNMLVLNGGKMWVEFCLQCGKKETIKNASGQEYTLEQVFEGARR